MIIRQVLPENAYDYTACHIACWQSAYRGIVPHAYLQSMSDELEQRSASMLEALNNPTDTYHFYYGEIHGKMAGRLIIGKSRDDDKPFAGEIGAFYLLEAHWDEGYGKAMMDTALDKLQGMGYREVLLWVLEENVRARRFYKKSGFTHDGSQKEIVVGKPLMEIRYTRPLP